MFDMAKINKYDVRLSEDNLPMLIKECTTYKKGRRKIHNWDDVVEWIYRTEEVKYLRVEELICICLNNVGSILGYFVISTGAESYVNFSMKNIFIKALALDADGIILLHNHPHGKISPSKADIKCMNNVKQAGKLLGITLTDFIIVDRNSCYYSAANEKKL
jgi:DNA repair protein RadC